MKDIVLTIRYHIVTMFSAMQVKNAGFYGGRGAEKFKEKSKK